MVSRKLFKEIEGAHQNEYTIVSGSTTGAVSVHGSHSLHYEYISDRVARIQSNGRVYNLSKLKFLNMFYRVFSICSCIVNLLQNPV